MGFKTAELVLAAAVVDDGTITDIAYPSGTNQAFFTGAAASATGKAILNNNDVYNEADPGVGITYGASTITVTNLSGVTWPAGAELLMQYGYNAGLEVSQLSGVYATAAEINRAADVSTRAVTLAATGAITEALHEGKTLLLNAAALVTLTLPAATGSGAKYEFYVAAVNTSSYVIQKASSDVFSGKAQVWDADASTGALVFDAAGSASSDVMTLNGTTTGGGRIGDRVQFRDIKAGVWAVEAVLHCPTGSNPATPFS